MAADICVVLQVLGCSKLFFFIPVGVLMHRKNRKDNSNLIRFNSTLNIYGIRDNLHCILMMLEEKKLLNS